MGFWDEPLHHIKPGTYGAGMPSTPGIFGRQQNNNPYAGMPQRTMQPGMMSGNNGGGAPGMQGISFLNQGYQNAGRAGIPQNGMVGSPQLGTVSELMRWASQVPNGMQQLQAMGMMPEISSYAPQQSYMQSGMGGPNVGGGGRGGDPRMSGSPQMNGGMGMQQPGMNNGLGGQSIQSLVNGTGSGLNREQSGFERGLEGTIAQLLGGSNESALRTRASDTIAGQQRGAEERTREDAVRRGASGSGGDADIRTELNRVSAEGGRAQNDASLDISQFLNQQKLGALGQGNQLLGNQLSDTRSIREMITMLQALMSQQGGQGGLSMILGGR